MMSLIIGALIPRASEATHIMYIIHLQFPKRWHFRLILCLSGFYQDQGHFDTLIAAVSCAVVTSPQAMSLGKMQTPGPDASSSD